MAAPAPCNFPAENCQQWWTLSLQAGNVFTYYYFLQKIPAL